MVRHTHRRRQSRGRRRNTRRSIRTQRGGAWYDFFISPPTDEDIQKLKEEIKKLQEKLNKASSPEEKADIQQELTIAQAKQQHAETMKQIKERGANGAAISSAFNANGAAAGYDSGFQSSTTQGGGRRRRSHRRR